METKIGGCEIYVSDQTGVRSFCVYKTKTLYKTPIKSKSYRLDDRRVLTVCIVISIKIHCQKTFIITKL